MRHLLVKISIVLLLCVRPHIAIVRFSYQMPKKPTCNAMNLSGGGKHMSKILFLIFF